MLLFLPFFRLDSWSSERLSDLPKVKQPEWVEEPFGGSRGHTLNHHTPGSVWRHGSVVFPVEDFETGTPRGLHRALQGGEDCRGLGARDRGTHRAVKPQGFVWNTQVTHLWKVGSPEEAQASVAFAQVSPCLLAFSSLSALGMVLKINSSFAHNPLSAPEILWQEKQRKVFGQGSKWDCHGKGFA